MAALTIGTAAGCTPVSMPPVSIIPGFDAFARVDSSAGYFHHFDSGWRIDAGAVVYVYPGESGSSFWEV